jgi:hypothetical protein
VTTTLSGPIDLVDPQARVFNILLDPETRQRRALLHEIWAKYRKMTREEAIAFLVMLGTHNPDGTLTEHYADNGEPSKYRPTD